MFYKFLGSNYGDTVVVVVVVGVVLDVLAGVLVEVLDAVDVAVDTAGLTWGGTVVPHPVLSAGVTVVLLW